MTARHPNRVARANFQSPSPVLSVPSPTEPDPLAEPVTATVLRTVPPAAVASPAPARKPTSRPVALRRDGAARPETETEADAASTIGQPTTWSPTGRSREGQAVTPTRAISPDSVRRSPWPFGGRLQAADQASSVGGRFAWSRLGNGPRRIYPPEPLSARQAVVADPDRVRSLTPAELSRPAPLVFTQSAWRAIESSVGWRRAESGGPLGGRRGSGIVEEFHFDQASAATAVTYYPDTESVNRLMREDWNPRQVNLLGFVHSHPGGMPYPSSPDIEYAGRIMAAIPELDRFLLPIVQTAPDMGRFSVHGYAVMRQRWGTQLLRLPIKVLPAPGTEASAADGSATPVETTVAPEFVRAQSTYDLAAMRRTRVVAVGCGGSAEYLEHLARAGVGEFVLIDPDVVEAANIATQQTYRCDIGWPKADIIARRLTEISPYVRVWSIQAWLDELSDDAMRRLVTGWLPGSPEPAPASVLLGAFTDSFEAQARLNRVGLNLGVPVVGGLVYTEGRGVEVTFSVPGVTPACSRCATRSRYVAYLERGFTNTVTSAGAPIWATARLNALKEGITLAILHSTSRVADPKHPATERYAALMAACAERNLVVASLDPQIADTLGLALFAPAADGAAPIEAVRWLRQAPDNEANGFPTCPDCGGTGDLTDSMGRFVTTVPMPRTYGDYRR